MPRVTSLQSSEEFDQTVANFLAIPVTDDLDQKPNKALALEVADLLTPEEAQQWYHFIVLVTKLVR